MGRAEVHSMMRVGVCVDRVVLFTEWAMKCE